MIERSCLTCKYSMINKTNIMLSKCIKIHYYIYEKMENPLCIGARTNQKWCGYLADWWEPFISEEDVIKGIEEFRDKYSKFD